MTLAASLANTAKGGIIVSGGGGQSQYGTAKLNDSGAFLTAAITFQGETNVYDVDLAASGERVDGIIVSDAFPITNDLSKDSDDPFDDNDWIRYYKPIKGDILWATVATATSISKDGWVKYADGFLTSATDKDDAIGKLENKGVAVTGSSGVEQLVTIQWGTD
jgi:hypothetical protein